MYYVYILRSESNPEHTYIGYTHDLRTRLKEHNAGKSSHTNKFKPWKISLYVAFEE
ncbi:MAG: GIY-YIG nuclease family protein [Candidatus Acidiferrales bacterium]